MGRASAFAALGLWTIVTVAACGESPPPASKTPAAARPATSAAAVASADALGPKPKLGAPKPFVPPSPEVFQTKEGMTVWLVERHTLPMVSTTLVVPYGSAGDPKEQPGLAYIAGNMLDEGAGARSALEISSAINELGASLSTGVSPDATAVSLTVLKQNFAPAFAILSDVVARPHFAVPDYQRVSDLWKNSLRERADDPASVSRVVSGTALYGAASPYGHPAEGFLSGAERANVREAKAFYAKHVRPDVATLVVVGDVTRPEVLAAVDAGLGSWKKPAGAAPAHPKVSALSPAERPRLVVVDRPGAPQSIVAVVRDGVPASDPSAPLLDLVNIALGGSFTSRLNQNLREDHGYSYGARSAFAENREAGSFVARAAVRTDVTGASVGEMLKELSGMAASGLRAPELDKVRAQDRSDLLQTYETVSGLSGHLGALASRGLGPTYDVFASKKSQAATLEELRALTPHVDPKTATVVVVGPRDQVVPQLASLGLGEPVFWDAEARPVTKAPDKAAGAAKGAKPKR
jgi:predicted Zn-dependent peptidase